MKVNCYAVLDHKLKQYRLCIFEIQDAGAMRQFSDAVNDPQNPFGWNRHPEDYSLWKVGVFDSENGTIEKIVIENLVNALAVQAVTKPPNQGELFARNGENKEPLTI